MDEKITDLVSATTPLAGTELVEIVQGGANKKVAVSNFGSAVPDATPTVKGILKLYTSLGTNTDGGVDQATLKNEIDAIAFEVSNVLENEILENGLIYQVPNIDGTYTTGGASQYLRLGNAPVVQNSVNDNFFGLSCGVFQTTATAGIIAGCRRNDAINLQNFNNVLFVRDFQVDANISNDCRYIVGLSKNYQFAFPTNNDPSVHTECIYVAKLSTSNNLHIVHNDNGGTATTIDLGANFPANSNLYKFRFSLTKRTASDYDLIIYRRTLSTGVILESATYNLTTNLPTAGGVLQQILAITNNATATNMRLGDYGLTIKKLPL